jgi:hypothetical protein
MSFALRSESFLLNRGRTYFLISSVSDRSNPFSGRGPDDVEIDIVVPVEICRQLPAGLPAARCRRRSRPRRPCQRIERCDTTRPSPRSRAGGLAVLVAVPISRIVECFSKERLRRTDARPVGVGEVQDREAFGRGWPASPRAATSVRYGIIQRSLQMLPCGVRRRAG